MRSLLLALLLAAGVEARQETAPPDAAGIEFFEQKVRPILVEKCYSCHSATAEKLKGNLYLDTREGSLKGGDLGPSVVPGDPERSLLVKAVRWTDDDLKMPPKKRLPAEQVADLEAWVKPLAKVRPELSETEVPEPDPLRSLEQIFFCRSPQIGRRHPDQPNSTIPLPHIGKGGAKHLSRSMVDLCIEIGCGFQGTSAGHRSKIVVPELEGDRSGQDLFVPELTGHPRGEQRENPFELRWVPQVAGKRGFSTHGFG